MIKSYEKVRFFLLLKPLRSTHSETTYKSHHFLSLHSFISHHHSLILQPTTCASKSIKLFSLTDSHGRISFPHINRHHECRACLTYPNPSRRPTFYCTRVSLSRCNQKPGHQANADQPPTMRRNPQHGHLSHDIHPRHDHLLRPTMGSAQSLPNGGV